jgi:D-glycero-alpha-D-manno-heptose 1-phosphate guanylyltransferase
MDPLADLTAAILVGGLGTRLRPVVMDRPKALAEVGGRPFLAHLLDRLAQAGIERAVLCTGYLGEQVEAAFGSRCRTLDLVYSPEPEPLGTAGSLRLALPLLRSDTVLVMNGDSFCDASLRLFLEWHCRRRARVSLALVLSLETGRYGRVLVKADGSVVAFREKEKGPGPGWISAGLYLIDRSLLAEIPTGRAVSLEREMFPAWVGHGLYGWQSDARLLDIGTPDSYADAARFLVP